MSPEAVVGVAAAIVTILGAVAAGIVVVMQRFSASENRITAVEARLNAQADMIARGERAQIDAFAEIKRDLRDIKREIGRLGRGKSHEDPDSGDD